MIQIPQKVHPDFRLNGFSHTESTLMDAAYSLIKEGEPYEMEIGDFLMDWLSQGDVLMVTTSGTTGIPKRLFIEREKMIASARLTGDYFDLIPGNSCLLALPARYIAGKMMLVRALVLGLHLTYVEPAASAIPFNTDFDFTALVPMQVKGSIRQIENIGTLLVGGAPLPLDLYKPLEESKADIFETYGMTETLTHIAVRKLNHTLSGRAEHVFTALPGVTFAQDERECLVLNATHLSLKEHVTNDVIELVSETEMIWKGRHDHVINTGGVKVHPEYLQNRFQDALERDVLISSVPDDQLGEKLIGVLEGDFDPQQIDKQLDELDDIHPYEKPKQWYSIAKFERNPAGKLNRNAILKNLKL